MKTYTILFSLDNRHFSLENLHVNEERQFSYQLGENTYGFTAQLKQVTEEPTAEHTGTGFVRIKSLRTSFDEALVCTIAKKKK
jgi:hypothetical protein